MILFVVEPLEPSHVSQIDENIKRLAMQALQDSEGCNMLRSWALENQRSDIVVLCDEADRKGYDKAWVSRCFMEDPIEIVILGENLKLGLENDE